MVLGYGALTYYGIYGFRNWEFRDLKIDGVWELERTGKIE